ncbi:MAG: hypothetical protein WCK09_17190, partial [Bacteroidota bacterium]
LWEFGFDCDRLYRNFTLEHRCNYTFHYGNDRWNIHGSADSKRLLQYSGKRNGSTLSSSTCSRCNRCQ